MFNKEELEAITKAIRERQEKMQEAYHMLHEAGMPAEAIKHSETIHAEDGEWTRSGLMYNACEKAIRLMLPLSHREIMHGKTKEDREPLTEEEKDLIIEADRRYIDHE